MNGTVRVTLDGVLSKDECESLLSLVQMASAGAVDTTRAHLFYYAGERARVLAQSYFEKNPLHFSYTQLVCRTAIE
ncbi:hypothetical protein AB205_0027980, partial [Aquarana catesbeiana]